MKPLVLVGPLEVMLFLWHSFTIVEFQAKSLRHP
jgi:hypothetical protein